MDQFVRDGYVEASEKGGTLTLRPDDTATIAAPFELAEGIRFISDEGSWRLLHDVSGGSNGRKANELKIEFDRDRVNHLCQMNLTEDADEVILSTLWKPVRWPARSRCFLSRRSRPSSAISRM